MFSAVISFSVLTQKVYKWTSLGHCALLNEQRGHITATSLPQTRGRQHALTQLLLLGWVRIM